MVRHCISRVATRPRRVEFGDDARPIFRDDPESELVGAAADQFAARVAPLANADVVDVDDPAVVEARNRHGAGVRAKCGRELFLGPLQRELRAAPLFDLLLKRQVLAGDLPPTVDALLKRLLRELVVFDKQQHQPDAGPVHVDEIEQKELRSPRDDRVDDEFQVAGTHETADERDAIDGLRHAVDSADAAGNQAGTRAVEAPLRQEDPRAIQQRGRER